MTDTAKRVDGLDSLPYQSILCLVRGHQWDDPPERAIDGWINVSASEMRFECPCGRWKREVIDSDTGDMLSRDYGGGIMTFIRVTRAEARAFLVQLKRMKKKRSRIRVVGK